MVFILWTNGIIEKHHKFSDCLFFGWGKMGKNFVGNLGLIVRKAHHFPIFLICSPLSHFLAFLPHLWTLPRPWIFAHLAQKAVDEKIKIDNGSRAVSHLLTHSLWQTGNIFSCIVIIYLRLREDARNSRCSKFSWEFSVWVFWLVSILLDPRC